MQPSTGDELRIALEQAQQRVLALEQELAQRTVTTQPPSHHSNDRFSRIFEKLPLLTWTIQPGDERIIDVNERFLDHVGLSRAEVIGRTTHEVGLIPSSVALAVSDGSRELEYLTRSGTTCYGVLSAVRIELDGQDCILFTVQDISEQRASQTHEQRLSTYLHAVIQAGDELLQVQDDHTFERRAIEILREKLGVERCALLLTDPERTYLNGTYGTSATGQTVDQHSYQIPLQPFLATHRDEQPWIVTEDTDLHSFEDGSMKMLSRGWLAWTQIRAGDQIIGILNNDSALTGAPLDITRQEAIAVYASLLGNILQRRTIERDLRASHQLLVESSNALMELAKDDTALYVDGEQVELKDLSADDQAATRAGLIYTPAHAVKIHQALRWQSDFLRILLMLSSRFINVPVDRLNEEIAHALEEVGTFVGMDRVYVFDYDFQRNTTSNTYEWCAEGIEPQIQELQDVPFEGLDDWISNHVVGRAMFIPDVQGLDPEMTLYQILAPQGILSLVTIPMMDGDECIGFIGFDAVRERHDFSEAERQLLLVVSQLLVNVRNRIRTLNDLRASEAQFRQLIESMQGGVAILDLDENITYANDRFCDMFGYSREEIIAQGLNSIFAPNQQQIVQEQNKLRAAGKSSAYELVATHRDGHPVYVLVNGSPMYDRSGTFSGSFAVAIDISVQKEAENTLRSTLEQEKEVGQLKTQFVLTTSHEFRTPLATILATTETLTSYRDRMDAEQIDKRLEKIRLQVEHLQQIMDDITQLERIQARRMDFNPVMADLVGLCEEIIEEFNNSSNHLNRIHYQNAAGTVEMMHDPRLIRQMLNNLLSNALKYSAGRDQVELNLLHDQDSIVLKIQDHGIGIPARDITRIFEPFHRSSNVGTIQGTGLGLAIVKEAVEVHRGSIQIESEVGKGSLVSVRLPLHQEYELQPVENDY